uniref:Cytosolic endo-beta-N-acetylglucosaminidase n=1 Tax=Strigamia maritima TaxID=126957 RepID=T1IYA4_STRMM
MYVVCVYQSATRLSTDTEGKMELVGCPSSAPESSPLTSLESIFKWCQADVHPCLPNSVNRQKRATINNSKWRCLVCHDMRDGYLQDRFVQGVSESHAYRFFHWSCIDIFVYFSHKFITIPPATWVDAAHLHGVKILGTVITEWEGGEKCCEEFLDSQDNIKQFVDKLVEVAVKFDLDGWLINIENKIADDKINNLKEFLRLLTDSMHKAVDESLVIWYDSVTEEGKLKWQNQLNHHNRCFFDSCDGIYLNYNWKDEELQKSVELADKRIHHVYAGIDVFGRGTLGGGGFNTKTPLEMIRTHDLSVAIFAPGWVYEVLGKQEFIEKEYEFWNLLLDYLPSHGPCSLPFATSFCQGFGDQFCHFGRAVDSSPWHNLSLQQYQPTISKQAINSRIHWKEAFEGGGCLRLEGEINLPFNLFTCSFSINEPVYLIYVWKNKSTTELDVRVLLNNSKGKQVALHSNLECCINDWKFRSFLINTEGTPTTITSVQILPKTQSNFDFLFGYFQLIPETFLNTFRDPMPVHLLDLVCGGTERQITALLTWKPSDRLRSFFPIFSIFALSSDGTTFSYLTSTRKNIFKLCGIRFPDGCRRFVIQPRLLTLQPTPIESCSYVDVTF